MSTDNRCKQGGWHRNSSTTLNWYICGASFNKVHELSSLPQSSIHDSDQKKEVQFTTASFFPNAQLKDCQNKKQNWFS